MEHTVIQPDESQTFLFKYGPYGEEHYFTVQEILQKMRAYYQQDFDSIVLLPYAYEAFGYFIAGCQIWDGSTNEIYLQNEEIMSIGYDYVIAVRPLYSNTMPMCAFGTDGQTSYSFGTTSMGTYYDGPPDYYIWNCFRGDYPVPFVFYTECDCPHIFINGTEYHSGDATVRVNYYLPDSDYEYARITYKKNDKPESVNDGTIVPISPSNSYIDIENLVEGKSYYFKIFTNKSESEAFPYTIPVDPVPPEYKQYIDYINGSGFNFKNYPITYGDRTVQPIVPTVISQMSWVVGKNYARWDKIYPSTPITVKLTGDTTHITVTYEGYSNSEYTKCNDSYRIMYDDESYDSSNPQDILLGDNVFTAYYGMNYYSVGNFTTEFAINNADNIQQALIFFTSRFKNIIIYVNNELWSNPF